MNEDLIAIIEESSAGSEAGRLKFPDVVRMLGEAGVERYHADLRRAEKRYYMPDGRSHAVRGATVEGPFAADFIVESVVAAIRAAQMDSIDYPEFCRRAAAAGCVFYLVSLPGRRVVYFGRTGESHVEHFPR